MRGKIKVDFYFYDTLSLPGKSFCFMDPKETLERGVFFSFIPRRLEVEDKPELNCFPFNVMFARHAVRDRKTIMGSAIYVPDFSTFCKNDDVCSMDYRNQYGGDGWLRIAYNVGRKNYSGEKFVGGKSVGSAYGIAWKNFFVHFTALGLSNGERCKFEEIVG